VWRKAIIRRNYRRSDHPAPSDLKTLCQGKIPYTPLIGGVRGLYIWQTISHNRSFGIHNQDLRMKALLWKLPECILIALLLAAAFTPPFHFHPFFLALAAILALQVIFKNRFTGITLGFLFLVVTSLFFLGALISEFNEFPDLNASAMQLLLVGASIWLIITLTSALMIYKYSRADTHFARN